MLLLAYQIRIRQSAANMGKWKIRIKRSIAVVMAAVMAVLLGARLGAWLGWVVWAVAITLGCALAARLVVSSTMGPITWRNRVAGLLLARGFNPSREKIPCIVGASCAGWIFIGGGAILLQFSPVPAGGMRSPYGAGFAANPLMATCIFCCWLIYGGLNLQQVGTIVGHFCG